MVNKSIIFSAPLVIQIVSFHEWLTVNENETLPSSYLLSPVGMPVQAEARGKIQSVVFILSHSVQSTSSFASTIHSIFEYGTFFTCVKEWIGGSVCVLSQLPGYIRMSYTSRLFLYSSKYVDNFFLFFILRSSAARLKIPISLKENRRERGAYLKKRKKAIRNGAVVNAMYGTYLAKNISIRESHFKTILNKFLLQHKWLATFSLGKQGTLCSYDIGKSFFLLRC